MWCLRCEQNFEEKQSELLQTLLYYIIALLPALEGFSLLFFQGNLLYKTNPRASHLKKTLRMEK